jgi:hypothetical protein
LDAGRYFDWAEIKAACVLAKKPQPARPSLNEVLGLIARRAGFLARKGDGEPGVKVIWKGLTKIRLVAEALREMNSAYA